MRIILIIQLTIFLVALYNLHFFNLFKPTQVLPPPAELRGLCLSGKNPDSLTPTEKLKEFIKGPCAPIVLVPGYMGTSLVVQINCQKLKDS